MSLSRARGSTRIELSLRPESLAPLRCLLTAQQRLQLHILGPSLGLMFLCWLTWETSNRQSGKLQLHRLYHSSSGIGKDQSELAVPELCFDTLQTLIN